MGIDVLARIKHSAGTALLIAAAWLQIMPAAAAVGAIPGQFAVSETGAATYTIPIAVPPGTAGMEPKLALAYNSQGGNGLLGVGWSLSGLSAITRCPRTIVQDGANGGVEYSSNDKYCLDGQRLVAVTGSYGADGTEYRTELESFTKVISYGTAGNGPAWFKAWTKSGQIIEYGNTTDSLIEAQGKTTAAVWAVNRIGDTKGNYLTATYTEDNANGQYYPSRIDYTGNTNTGLATYNSVQFVYEVRPDTSPQYVGGSLVNLIQRLTTLRTYTGSALTREYQLSYQNSAAPNNSSRLVNHTVCDGGGICMPPTTLNWQQATGANGFGPVQNLVGAMGDLPISVGDINGDGRSDIAYIIPAWSSYSVYVSYSNGNGFSSPILAYSGCLSFSENGCMSPAHIALGDINGDGLADLIVGGGKFRLSTGNGFGPVQNLVGAMGDLPISVGDINGDGRSDIAYIIPAWSSYSVYVSYSNGNGFSSPILAYSGCLSFSENGCMSPAHIALGDINGDGLADLIVGGGKFRLSTGNGFGPVQNLVGAMGDLPISVGDINGDGRSDIAYIIPAWSSYSVYMSYSNGNGFSSPILAYSGCLSFSENGCMSPAHIALGDINGDGLADLIVGGGKSRFATAPTPDLLTDITTGLGAHTHIAYSTLSDAATYTPETGGIYPVRDLLTSAPFYLVSEITSDDGAGHDAHQTHHYTGAKTHLTGRGILGFRVVESTNQQTNLVSRTEYRQDHPYTGLPSLSEKRHNGTLLNRSTPTYGLKTFGSGASLRNFPYAQQSVEESYELSGSLVTQTTTSQTYDDWGNPTQIVVTSNDGHGKTTVNTYDNDTSNWILGRLRRATVTSTAP